MRRLRREELNEQLQGFGVQMSDRMLQHAIKGIGIRPTYIGVSGGKGKTSWFDPIDAWVIATAELGRECTWTDKSVRLGRECESYETAAGLDGAAAIPGFLSDPTLALKLLYIASWEGGFPLTKLFEALSEDSGLYELSMYEPTFLEIWLMSYKLAVGETWADTPLPKIATAQYLERVDASVLRDRFLSRLIEQAAVLCAAAGFNGDTPTSEEVGPRPRDMRRDQ